MDDPWCFWMNRDLLTIGPEHMGMRSKESAVLGRTTGGAKGRTNVIGALLGRVLLGTSFGTSLFGTTINTKIFNAWVIQNLIQKLPPRSIVVMDNASFHKGTDMVKALEKAGHTLLYLPTYSPDLNPIEKKWAERKALRRRLQCFVEALFQNDQFVIKL